MSRRYDDNPLMNENNQGPSWKKVLGISLSIILAIVAIGVVVIYNIGHDLITRSNYKSDDEVKVVNELPQEAQETVSTEEKKGVVLNEEELNDIHEQMNNMNEVEAVSDDSVYNLLLVGVDRREYHKYLLILLHDPNNFLSFPYYQFQLLQILIKWMCPVMRRWILKI